MIIVVHVYEINMLVKIQHVHCLLFSYFFRYHLLHIIEMSFAHEWTCTLRVSQYGLMSTFMEIYACHEGMHAFEINVYQEKTCALELPNVTITWTFTCLPWNNMHIWTSMFLWYIAKWVQLNSNSSWSIVVVQNIEHEFDHLISC